MFNVLFINYLIWKHCLSLLQSVHEKYSLQAYFSRIHEFKPIYILKNIYNEIQISRINLSLTETS